MQALRILKQLALYTNLHEPVGNQHSSREHHQSTAVWEHVWWRNHSTLHSNRFLNQLGAVLPHHVTDHRLTFVLSSSMFFRRKGKTASIQKLRTRSPFEIKNTHVKQELFQQSFAYLPLVLCFCQPSLCRLFLGFPMLQRFTHEGRDRICGIPQQLGHFQDCICGIQRWSSRETPAVRGSQGFHHVPNPVGPGLRLMELIQHHPASWIFSCMGACIVIHEMAVK